MLGFDSVVVKVYQIYSKILSDVVKSVSDIFHTLRTSRFL